MSIATFKKSLFLSTALVAMTASVIAQANPEGGVVVGGEATITSPSVNVLNVNQATDRVVIDWDSFNIDPHELTEFFQPGSSSLAVNRVVGDGQDPSRILGTLRANGQIMVLDRNGVMFGAGSVVDVGGIVASTGDVDTAAVMRGDSRLDMTNTGQGSIELNGTVSVANSGLAAFVAPTVVNNGVIVARVGRVAMGAGTQATLDLYGDKLIEIAADDAVETALLENNGTIDAEGGTVIMTAQTARDVVDNVINLNGVTKVSSAQVQGGKIILSAGSKGTVRVAGSIDASGSTGGGSVDVRGRNIHVTDTARINADATTVGDGGRVIILADEATLYEGVVTARGGALGGNGGFVETSGLSTIEAYGDVDASAVAGLAGTWLIDPRNLVIEAASNRNVTGGSPFSPTGGLAGSRLNVASLNAALNVGGGTNVVVTTIGSPAALFQDGTITVDANITKTAGTAATLTLNAAGSIVLNSGRSITSSSNVLNVAMTAGAGITINGTINTNGGDVTMAANGGPFLGFSTGNVTIGGTGVVNAAGGDIAIANVGTFTGAANSVRTSGTGTIALNQNTSLLSPGSIQNAIDAINNTGTGLNTVNVGAGLYLQNINANHDNLVLRGAKAGVAGNDTARGTDETTIGLTGTAVTVNADNVTIDGFLVGLVGTGFTVASGSDGTVIQNNIATLAANSIVDDGSSNLTVTNNQVSGVGGSGITLNGTQTANVTSNVIASTTAAGVAASNASGITIQNNTINNVGTHGVSADTVTGLAIKGNTITNAGQHGVSVANSNAAVIDSANNISGSGQSGVRVSGGTGSTVSGNTITGGINGVLVAGGASGLIVTNNTINDQTTNGLFVRNGTVATLTGNNFGTMPTFIRNEAAGTFVNASNNVFNGLTLSPGFNPSTGIVDPANPTQAELDILFALEGKTAHKLDNNAFGTVWYVANNWFVDTVNTIQAAVNASANGDTIYVNKGTFAESVTVDRDVTVRGYQYGQNAVTRTGLETIVTPNSPGFLITSNGVTLDGFTINSPSGVDGHGVSVDGASNVLVQNNIVNNPSVHGIYVLDGSNNTVRNNVVNTAGHSGVFVSASDNAQILGNTLNGFVNQGIYAASDNVDIFGNTVTGTGAGNGIMVQSSSNVDIGSGDGLTGNANKIDNVVAGIVVDSGSNVVIDNNEIDRASYAGIVANGVNTVTIVDNNIDAGTTRNSGSFGIQIDNGAAVTVGGLNNGNVIDDYETGIYVSGATGGGIDTVQIDRNTVTDGYNGIYVSTVTTKLDITNNALTNGTSPRDTLGTGIRVHNSANVDIGNGTFATPSNTINQYNTGIRVEGGSNVEVDGNSVTNANVGINASGVNGLRLFDNNVDAGSTRNSGADGILVSGGSNITIGAATDGNSVDDFTNGIRVTGGIAGINTVSIDSNTVTDGDNGIDVSNVTTKLDITNNTLTNGFSPIDPTAIGIRVANSNNVDIGNGSSVTPSNVISQYNTGVRVEGGSNVEVDGNSITNANLGIDTSNVNTLRVFDNNVDAGTTRNTGTVAGIRVTGGTGTVIGAATDGNNVDDFVTGILVAGGTIVSIDSNTVTDGDNGIDVSNVTTKLDITNNTLTNGFSPVDPTATGIRVANSNNVDIGNGTSVAPSNVINQYNTGVRVEGGSNVEVDGNSITNANLGIDTNNVSTLRVFDNTLDGRTGSGRGTTGINVVGGSNALIGGDNDGNVVQDFTTGVALNGTSGVSVDDNDIRNVNNGINAVLVSGTVNVRDNDVDAIGTVLTDNPNGSGNTGIFVSTVDGSTVVVGGGYGLFRSGTSDGNRVDDFATGISVNGGNNTVVDSNYIFDASTYGIYASDVDSGPFPGLVNGLRIVDNEVDGLYSGTRNGIAIYVTGSRGAQIGGLNDGNSIANVDRGIEVANSRYATVSYNDVTNTDNHGIVLQDSNDNTVENNTVVNAGLDAVRVNSSDRATITLNTLTDTQDDAVRVIGSQDVKVTTNTISNTTDAAIYLSNTDNVLVSGNIITDANTGVRLDDTGTNGAVIDENTITRATIGVSADGVQNLTVTDNVITGFTDPSIATFGIYVDNSDNALIGGLGDANTVSSFQTGIRVLRSDNAEVSFNAVNSFTNFGVRASGSDGILIRRNTISNAGNPGTGIFVSGSDFAVVRRNNVSDVGGDAIRITDSADAVVRRNTLTNIGGDAIDARRTDRLDVYRNTINGTGANGVSVLDSVSAIVRNNVIDNAGTDGIFAQNSNLISVLDNTVNNAGNDGIEVSNSNGALVDNNAVTSAGANGVKLSASADSSITNNSVSDAGFDGIFVDRGVNSTIANNIVQFSGANGIRVDGTTGAVVIRNNQASNNGNSGIRVANLADADIRANAIFDNRFFGINSGPGMGAVNVQGNNFFDNAVHASFESGLVDLSGVGNTFISGLVGLRFMGSDVRLVNDTIGAQRFDGQSSYFVELLGDALFNPGTPTIISALDSTFVTPFGEITPRSTGGVLSPEVFAFLSNRIFDFSDDPTLGLIFAGFVPGSTTNGFDPEDLYNSFGAYGIPLNDISVTILGGGVPRGATVGAAAPAATFASAEALNAIETAAGGELSPQSLDAIETAAGGAEQINCWNDAGGGGSYNYSFGANTFDQATLAAQAGCRSQ